MYTLHVWIVVGMEDTKMVTPPGWSFVLRAIS